MNWRGTDNDDDRRGTGTKDVMHGNGGDDRIAGLGGDDQLFGGFGNDALIGGDGKDKLYGGADNDVLYGGEKADTLDGGDNNDKLFGGEGNDALIGGKGNDTLSGGYDRDVLTGGEGRDTFRITNEDRLVPGNDSFDVITDFEVGRDKIDLSMIDARDDKSGIQEFKLVEYQPGQVLRAGEVTARYDFEEDKTIVAAAVDNDGRADYLIELKGEHTLGATDFNF